MTYSLASTTWDEAEYAAIKRVVDSGMFTMGPRVAEFEDVFSKYVGSRYCVMVNSGSSANLLMVAALFYRKTAPLRRGDEVIVPAVSWSTTYFPLYQYGLKLKFVDVDLQSLNYDLEQLKSAISDRTRLIVAVNLLGNPQDFAMISEFIGSREIVLVEDNCESLGAEYGGRQAGTFGLMGSFSTFFSHHISTMEGGVVATDDEELYHILLSLRAHGWTRNLPKENHVCGVKSDDAFVESFRFVLPGYNVRPLELSGAIGVEQLRKLPEFVRIRRQNAERFQAMMPKFPQFSIQHEIGRSSWFGFSIILGPACGLTRSEVIAVLNKAGIESRPIVAGNFVKNEAVRWMDYSIHGSLSNAGYLDEHGFFVGNHHYPMDKELALLERVLGAFAKHRVVA